MKIRSYLLIGTLGFFVLFMSILIANTILIKKKEGDGLAINLAGRQRMLSQKIAKEAAMYFTAPTTTNRELLQSTVRLFVTTHVALIKGGVVSLNLDQTNQKTIPASTDQAFIKQLNHVGAIWKKIQTASETLLRANTDKKRALGVIIGSNVKLLKEMNKAVGIRQKDSEQKNVWNLYVQIIALIVGGFFSGLLLILGHRIGASLTQLTEAAEQISLGEADDPIKVQGVGEIADLAQAFERMRRSTQKALQALDSAM